MKPLEATELLEVASVRFPHHGQDERAPDLWAQLLADVDVELGRMAVAHMLAEDVEPHPAAIRRWVAERCGVMPPPFNGLPGDVADLLAQWATYDARGDKVNCAWLLAQLVLAGLDPELAESAGRAMGDLAVAVLSGENPTAARAQLRDLYDQQRARFCHPTAPGALAGVSPQALVDAAQQRASLLMAMEGYRRELEVWREDPEHIVRPELNVGGLRALVDAGRRPMLKAVGP